MICLCLAVAKVAVFGFARHDQAPPRVGAGEEAASPIKKRDITREQLDGRTTISIWRTPGGWGTGPSYRIHLYGDGHVSLWGLSVEGQDRPGDALSFNLDPSVFDLVGQEFHRLRADHCDNYVISDQGTIHYRLVSEGETAEFSVYTGCFDAADRGQRLSKVIKDALGITAPESW